MNQRRLAFANRRGPDGLFELEHEACTNRLDDRRGAALLAILDLGEVEMLFGVHVGDGAAARDCRDAIRKQIAAGDENTRSAGPSDHLVGREEDRIFVIGIAY